MQEHHLQAAISASQAAVVGGKVAQIFIPTPDTIQSNIQYDRCYPLQFSQPATYIRFSSTVEDCSGCQYCMTAEDDAFLKSMNLKRPASSQCCEDRFEEVMDFFEQTARTRQPFAAVDNPPVVTMEEMESSFDENIDESSRPYVNDIYPHWKNQRLQRANKLLMPGLKVRATMRSRTPLTSRSSRPGRRPMMPIRMSVSDGGKCGRSGRHEVETHRAQRNSGSFGRNWKTLEN